jgi:hypothetical protein
LRRGHCESPPWPWADLDLSDPRASNRALFENLRRYGLAHLALESRSTTWS